MKTSKKEKEKDKKIGLSMNQIKQLVNDGIRMKEAKENEPFYKVHKEIRQTMDLTRLPVSEEFVYQVKKCGGSSHIMLPKRWLGRTVKVRVEEVKE